MTKFDVRRKHPAYEAARRRRKLALDLYEGGERVEGINSVDGQGHTVHAGACYLVRHAYEPESQWNTRLTRAAYRNFAAPIVDLFAAFINEKRPPRRVPESLRPLERDGDRNGRGADPFFADVSRLAAAGGARHVLVDMERPRGRTVDEDRRAGRRQEPYFVSVDPDDVWDWQFDDQGLAWVALHGMAMTPRAPGEEPMFQETVTFWTRTEWVRYGRELSERRSKGGEAGGGEKFVEVARGEHPCRAVPLVPFVFEDDGGGMTGMAATDDVLSLILKIYRNDSEMDKMLFDRAVPEKVVTGLSDEERDTYRTSSYNCLFHRNVDGIRAYYVEPRGQSFDALARQIEKDEGAVREIALRMVRPRSAVGESAEARQIDRKQLDTQLALYARACAHAEARCWRLAARWAGVAEEGVETPYRENYDVEEAASVLADRLLALAREKVISRAALLRSPAVLGLLPEGFNPEDNARELREERDEEQAGGVGDRKMDDEEKAGGGEKKEKERTGGGDGGDEKRG